MVHVPGKEIQVQLIVPELVFPVPATLPQNFSELIEQALQELTVEREIQVSVHVLLPGKEIHLQLLVAPELII